MIAKFSNVTGPDLTTILEMVNRDAERTGERIRVELSEPIFGSVVFAEGSRHAVMRLIGLLADHGEDSLVEVKL